MKSLIAFLGFMVVLFSQGGISPSFVSADEVGSKECLSQKAVDEQTEQILGLYDSDKNGRLDKDEYAHATMHTFEAIDQDGSNALETRELDNSKDRDVPTADSNQDGKLSFTEILKYQEKAFQEKDMNRDGALSKEEIAASIAEKGCEKPNDAEKR